MNDNGGNYAGSSAERTAEADIARLYEREARNSERLRGVDATFAGMDSRIDGIEALLAQRDSWRGYLPLVIAVGSALVGGYSLGLKPVKDKIESAEAQLLNLLQLETKQREKEDAQIREGFKFGINAILDERELRYQLRIKALEAELEKLKAK